MPYAANGEVHIYYEVEGEGPPIVMLHGFAASLEDWREKGYVDALKGNYQCILVDLIGHGKSDKPHNPESYTMVEIAGDLIAVLDDLNIDSVHMMGFSGGGGHCLTLAKYALERVKSLILISSGPKNNEPESINRARQMLQGGPEAFVAAIERGGPLKPEFKARTLANDFEALSAIVNSPSLEAEWDLTNNLVNMKVPFLVIIGENDFNYPPQEQKELYSVVDDLKFIMVPGMGHSIEQTDTILPHVKEFLTKVNK